MAWPAVAPQHDPAPTAPEEWPHLPCLPVFFFYCGHLESTLHRHCSTNEFALMHTEYQLGTGCYNAVDSQLKTNWGLMGNMHTFTEQHTNGMATVNISMQLQDVGLRVQKILNSNGHGDWGCHHVLGPSQHERGVPALGVYLAGAWHHLESYLSNTSSESCPLDGSTLSMHWTQWGP